MTPELHLAIHNVLSITAAIMTIALAFFTYLNGRKQASNIAFSLLILSGAIFFISHVIGVNVADPELSKNILMWNLAMFWAGAFLVHAVAAVTGDVKRVRWLIWFLYISSFIFTVFFLISPELFLVASTKKMYFVNYYQPGIFNWMRMAFLYALCIPYACFLLATAYKNSTNYLEKKQYAYLMFSLIIVFIFIYSANLLVYDIHFDPIWSMVAPAVFAIPFIYGAVQYGMMNVKVIAKQAFWYATAIATVGAIILLLNYSNSWIIRFYPHFPTWITSLVSSVLVVSFSYFVWHRFRDIDLLKYEFISTVTHKFRTPLTHIKWAAENIAGSKSAEETLTQLQYIQQAESKLSELTNLLVKVSEEENKQFTYRFDKNDLGRMAKEVLAQLSSHVAEKKLDIDKNLPVGLIVSCDASRIRFVMQTLIENAISYTDNGGTVKLSLSKHDKYAVFAVQDSGIGIPKEELSLIFSKFYRGQKARVTDTEGMGIGLFISKKIIEQHRGKISVASEGPGKGSTFSIMLPLAK